MLEIHFALNCSSNNNARVFVTMIMYEPNNIVTIKYFKLPSLISPFCLVTKRTRSNMIFVKTPVFYLNENKGFIQSTKLLLIIQ